MNLDLAETSATKMKAATKICRRAFLGLGLLSAPTLAVAFSPWQSDYVKNDLQYEPITSQQVRPGKLDLNAAAVQDYQALEGMYPHAAGQIASHGPYEKVKDVYDIPGLTKKDIELFKKYESAFTVLPPGRMFVERLNSRQSQ